MFARSTTVKGDPGAIDDGIRYIRDEVMPAVTALDGCLGLSLVVDRETGLCIATTSWETEEAMVASRAGIAPMRERGGEVLGGSPQVEEWEVGAMHRDHTSHDGCCCRITWTHANDPETVTDSWRANVLPRVEAMDGFCSASFLLDRVTGRTCGTVTFDSRAALEASREAAAAIRERAVREMGVEILDVAELDLEIAHLRLPELV
ncbi:hypothetical protein ACT8ZV_17125 [Nocardioides sp. MAHUQ-72]|uniref:hypothetical protein n=1 Tax=unclassified Nocardioides TaxID=2615069 RepID=UPI0036087697